ncbi:MAG: Eco57I restriction-modification methylase domain-containing protein [Anaeroplasmataceae bacterium]|nr:Eco57I restriction-modification methylase domain-containing protein [Anaeroplasmataceae bacterium]
MSGNSVTKFNNTFDYKLIYVFAINDAAHQGALKIGDATIHTSKSFTELAPNCHDLNSAAKNRIDSYTITAGIEYHLLHTEIAVYKETDKNSKHYNKIRAFRDYNVHSVLKKSGIQQKFFDTEKRQNEWFITDLETVKKAISAVKNSKSALDNCDITNNQNPIIFRPEQQDAIRKTIERFKIDNDMLWNAKMRFGKTLSALQVAKEMNFEKTIIITHRPAVSEGWYEDFDKIFFDRKEYCFASKTLGKSIKELLNENKKFVYFASIQDLRGSDTVGGNFNKNDEIFTTLWDFVVVDEAHEGTQTTLGKEVLKQIIKPDSGHNTKILSLSGTPFNLITNFEENSIYTWDYIMEQEEKEKWAIYHHLDSNPYEELPRMNIFTYYLDKIFTGFVEVEDKAFNFREFFRTWTGNVEKDGQALPSNAKVGNFIHEKDIESFLDLITKESKNSNYPFSTLEYRDYFRHTLWILPGVKEAKALSKLMKTHKVFKNFTIVNVAGAGDEEQNASDALSAVRKAITKNPSETYTITLSCGRLTTGVSVPEWTAVLMLAGSYSTAASQYLQTIFRVQTPANINGKIKENCYVFDFAPDRTLKMVAESVQLSTKSSNSQYAEQLLGKFLNYCPVISIDSSKMKEFKVSELLQELKKAYAERVLNNGFDDPKLYNDELLKLTDIELKDFENLEKIVGKSKQTKANKEIDINNQGFSEEEYEQIQKIQKKPKKELTEEEKQKLAELKKNKDNRSKAISILRAISIRIPLIVYGLNKDINVDITLEEFTNPDLIDDLSWNEFMPKDVTRELFKKFIKYYDKDIFIAASRKIRLISKSADDLEPTQRVQRIVKLFSSFKNPDKETVLTPWRVVNMHMSDTLGGYDFFDENHLIELEEPRYVDRGKVTDDTLANPSANILEINSKTGLYPLYVTYSIYRAKCNELGEIDKLTFEQKQKIWDDVVQNNVFVICKTPMAKSITQKTLIGYRGNDKLKANTKYFEDLVNQLRQENKLENFISKVKKGSHYWNRKDKGNDMKFNAIVGNPPYQENIGNEKSNKALSKQLFPWFIIAALKMGPDYLSMITPSRWFTGEAQDKSFIKLRSYIKSNNQFKKIVNFYDNKLLFKGVTIGSVNYFLCEKNYTGDVEFVERNETSSNTTFRPLFEEGLDEVLSFNILSQFISKVKKRKDFVSLIELTTGRNPFGVPDVNESLEG